MLESAAFSLAMSARASTLGSRIFRPSLLAKGLRSIEFETTNCCQRGLGKISLLGIPVVSNSRFAPEAHGFFLLSTTNKSSEKYTR